MKKGFLYCVGVLSVIVILGVSIVFATSIFHTDENDVGKQEQIKVNKKPCDCCSGRIERARQRIAEARARAKARSNENSEQTEITTQSP